MRFRIVRGVVVEYPKVGSLRMALHLAEDAAVAKPGEYIDVQLYRRRESMFCKSQSWETCAVRFVPRFVDGYGEQAAVRAQLAAPVAAPLTPPPI